MPKSREHGRPATHAVADQNSLCHFFLLHEVNGVVGHEAVGGVRDMGTLTVIPGIKDIHLNEGEKRRKREGGGGGGDRVKEGEKGRRETAGGEGLRGGKAYSAPPPFPAQHFLRGLR